MDGVLHTIIALFIMAVVMLTIILGMINGDPPDNQNGRGGEDFQDLLREARRKNPHEPHQPPE